MIDFWWFHLWAFPIGLVVGSFLNICVFRLPTGQSVVSQMSQCPSCHSPMTWSDTIPVISYIWLGCRCRHCQTPISLGYPILELMNGLGYVGVVIVFGWTVAAVVYAIFYSSLLVVAWIDLDHLIIPDAISLPGIVIGLVAAVMVLPIGFMNSLIGALLGGGILWVLAILSSCVFGKEGLGGGDIKLLAMIGAFLGWQPVLLTLILASVFGAVVTIGLIVFKVVERGHYIPFGSFLAFGALIALFFHVDIVEWYLAFL